jgi:hypothetical protein
MINFNPIEINQPINQYLEENPKNMDEYKSTSEKLLKL